MPLLRPYNLQVMRTPFEVVGVQACLPSLASPSNPRHFPVGVSGVRELAYRHAQSAPSSPTSPSPSAASVGPSSFLCCQQKGQLLACGWEDLRQVGTCSHGAHTTVAQCIVTAGLLITRIACDHPDDALQSDHNVYVWDAATFARLYELHGHSARVTSMAVHPRHPHILVTAALDYVTCVWELSAQTANSLTDEETRGLGTITHLEWLLPHCRLGRPAGMGGSLLIAAADVPLSVWRWDGAALAQVAAAPVSSSSAVTAVHARTPSHASQCVVHTGSTDGCVRRWVIDGNPADETCAIELIYQVKLHHASINHLLANDRINVSGSLYSGVALYHCQKGTRAMFEEVGGVTSMLLDDTNKLVLVGAANGLLWIISYAQFETAEAKATTSEATTLYRVCVGKTAVNGILLELANDSTWKQLLTVCSNGYITVFDYRLRHVQTISPAKAPIKDSSSGLSTSAAAVPFFIKTDDNGKKLLIAHTKTNSIVMINPDKPNSTKYGSIVLPKYSVVTCVRWDAAVRKMFIGVQRDSVRSFSLDSGNQKPYAWVQMDYWKLKSYFPTSFSASVQDIIMVCLTDNPNALGKAQGLLGVLVSNDSKSERDSLVVLKSLEDSVPFSVTLLESFTKTMKKGSPDWKATAVVQNTRGVIEVFSVEATDGQDNYQVTPKVMLTPPSLLAFPKPIKDENMLNPFFCRPSYIAKYENSSSKDAITVSWVEKFVLFSSRIYTSMDYKQIVFEPIQLPSIPSHSPSSFVREVHLVNSHEVSIAVLYNNSMDALLIGPRQPNEKDISIFVLGYSGEVLQHNGGKWNTKETGITTDEAESNKKMCICISSYSEQCYVAFGYTDGLVQLLDTSRIYVFARLWMGSAPLRGLWCFQKDVIVEDDNFAIYSTPLHRRYLFDTLF